VELKTLTKQ